MAGFKDAERGIRSPLSVRVGIDLPKFRGQNEQQDPAAINDDQFQRLENVRLDGTAIKPRPGLAALLDEEMDGCVIGLFDDRNQTLAFGLFWTL